jgi:predicted component of type VI protein secretion system
MFEDFDLDYFAEQVGEQDERLAELIQQLKEISGDTDDSKNLTSQIKEQIKQVLINADYVVQYA